MVLNRNNILHFEHVRMVDHFESCLFIAKECFGGIISDGFEIDIFDGNRGMGLNVVTFIDYAGGTSS